MIEKLFRLTWKKGCLSISAFIGMFILHNLLSSGGDEAITFIITVFVIPAYLITCIVYSALNKR